MTARHGEMFLHEEIMLLALADEEGTIAAGSLYRYALGGAALAELLMRKRLRIDESRRKKLVHLVNAKPMGEPVLDDCLARIRDARKRASPQTWVARFAGVKNLQHRLALGLCERGILRAEEGKMLFVFTRRIYPEIDPEPERRLVERLRAAIFEDAGELDPRTVVLVSLAHSADLLKSAFDKRELKSRQARIAQIVNGEATGKATKEAIEAMQAALLVTCIIPTVVSSATR